MDRLEIIKLSFVVCLIIVGNVLNAQSNMDKSDQNIVEAFEAHNLPEISKFILNNRVVDGEMFYVDNNKYLAEVEIIREPTQYYDTRNSTYINDGKRYITIHEIIPKGDRKKGKYKKFRTYEFFIENGGFQVYSENIFFNMTYRNLTEREKKEIMVDKGLSLPKKVFDLQENVSTFFELKIYGFLYAYDFERDILLKVADYVVRDANGRANSMGKQYGKNRSFTDHK